MLLASLLSVLVAGGALQARPAEAQEPQPPPTATLPPQEQEPRVGQRGKDVPWLPTPQALVDKMLDMAKVTRADYVIDLGSGDGRLVIAAARRGARALGIEYDPGLVELSKRKAAEEGLGDRAAFVKADLFESDFSRADVITMFLLSSVNLKLRPKILDLRPGTRVVSNTFDMGDWKPDETARIEGCNSWCVAHLWVVPAQVGGTWTLPRGELTLEQDFQRLTGTLKSGDGVAALLGELHGAEISFTAAGVLYTGRVSGDSIQGKSEPGGKWRATRARR